jgi:hypothetical protein
MVCTTCLTVSSGRAVTIARAPFASISSRTVPSPPRKPFSRIHSSLKTFEKYPSAPSHSTTTMFSRLSRARAYLIAPATAAPLDPPQKSPSCRTRSRVVAKHSRSSTRITSSSTFMSSAPG